MIQLLKTFCIFFIGVFLFSSCATIVGGSKYNAYVSVPNHSDAKIRYNGVAVNGGGLSVLRKDANKLSFEVSKEGCPTKEYNFTRRRFRGWAFVGSLFFPTIYFIPIPNIVDFAFGAYWKPDTGHPSIVKSDYNNYYYNLDYECATNSKAPTSQPAEMSKGDKLIELKELFDKGMITKEEYEKSRQEILNK